MSRTLMAGAGAAIFVISYAVLLLTGHTALGSSADPGATKISMWYALLPALAAMLLARLVPPATAPPQPLADLPRGRLVRETWALLTAAAVFSVAAAFVRGSELYPLVKVLTLLVAPLVAFRLLRGDGPKARSMPAPVTWLAPLPAVVAWFVLAEASPLAPPLTQELPDPVTLAIASLVTLLTAGVLEEVFYRGWLQTRLEALIGRWPAILASSLAFALMHTSHIDPAEPVVGLLTVIAVQGVFGLMQGYLWARYRNIWVIILIHVLTNLVYVDLLMGR